MNPEKNRRRLPHAGTVNTTLVQFTSVPLPEDSPEFQERQRLAAQRPIPDYVREMVAEFDRQRTPPPPAAG